MALTTKPTTKSKITMSLKLQTSQKEDGRKEKPQTLHLPLSPEGCNQKGDTNVISPKLPNRIPTMVPKVQKPDPPNTTVMSNEQGAYYSRTQSSEMSHKGQKLQTQKSEMALLSIKIPQPRSLSPKPSTHRQVTGTRHCNTSDSSENLDSKDSSAGSESRTSSKASSDFKTVANNSLDSKNDPDSKASLNSKTGTGSRDSLDSKSGSTSKTSLGSKDSLDSKTGSNSKTRPALATSTPKTRPVRGECTPEPAAVELNPSNTSHNTSLTRGLTFDSITKTQVKTGNTVEEQHLKLPETKVTADRGPGLSHGARHKVDPYDNTGSSRGEKKTPGTLSTNPDHLGDAKAITATSNILSSRATGVETKKNEKKQEKNKKKESLGSSSSPLHPLPPSSSHPASSKRVKEAATMTDPGERLHHWAGARREVGVQVEVDVDECSASTSLSLHKEAPTSSLIGSPSCQSGSLTSPTDPSKSCIRPGQPPLQHVCKIDIELCSQSVLCSDVTDKASSLPACLPVLTSELQLRQNQDGDISTESICEGEKEGQEEDDDKILTNQNKEATTVKPQEVEWDEQGMTWEVYGASIDLESLGTAIQSHLNSKVREQEKRISTLKMSTCTNSRGKKMKKRRKRRGGILGCCRKTPAVAD
ncbi:dentin sialophosphoprotein-like [Mastacembelus armatus]|uniref:dentin sialophosphoprotein-like n=1 Tax=Mastacembelus armatus TaxID=205130 RepID=UPI000E45DD72|nr:dentin sialophosphoprotein-like [Mastacembelus armatus]XP_026178351.1 dentin sialophosphoprotein-like [Mastacembelus armatus]XP_026178361.1 dentin sialophosphoprotein-like [Mastacembelus armatus]